MKSSRAWILYTLIRVLAFAIPFGIIMITLPDWEWNWLLGAVVGTIIGLCVSYIFLRGPSEQIGEDLHRLRNRSDTRSEDSLVEDAELDAAKREGKAVGVSSVEANAAPLLEADARDAAAEARALLDDAAEREASTDGAEAAIDANRPSAEPAADTSDLDPLDSLGSLESDDDVRAANEAESADLDKQASVELEAAAMQPGDETDGTDETATR